MLRETRNSLAKRGFFPYDFFKQSKYKKKTNFINFKLNLSSNLDSIKEYNKKNFGSRCTHELLKQKYFITNAYRKHG